MGMRSIALVCGLFGFGLGARAGDASVSVGSKRFTESVILGEIAAEAARTLGLAVTHQKELGGTQLLWKALLRGDIDVYPDYTGTIIDDTLAGKKIPDFGALEAELAKLGVGVTRPLGFNNTYALGMPRKMAEALQIKTISALARHPELPFGFSHEFLDRAEGWESVRKKYALPQQGVQGIEHELAYKAIAGGQIAVTDLYSTDAEIAYHDLVTLEDDLRHFPRYDAVFLYRLDAAEKHPELIAKLRSLAGEIPESRMIAMNARAKIEKIGEALVAQDFTRELWGDAAKTPKAASARDGMWGEISRRAKEHLFLVLVSLIAAVVVALPLGVFAARRPRVGQVILAISGIFQTIPSLALLVFLIPTLGIGSPPAIAALFVYSLLPVVRNTYTGLRSIPAPLMESAAAVGLPAGARLWRIELPLAARSILAGIKTSAVINVGTATLGALIGAGGFGQPILVGIRRDDFGLILQGAIPAAVLALLMQGLFEVAERFVVSKGLRYEAKGLT